MWCHNNVLPISLFIYKILEDWLDLCRKLDRSRIWHIVLSFILLCVPCAVAYSLCSWCLWYILVWYVENGVWTGMVNCLCMDWSGELFMYGLEWWTVYVWTGVVNCSYMDWIGEFFMYGLQWWTAYVWTGVLNCLCMDWSGELFMYGLQWWTAYVWTGVVNCLCMDWSGELFMYGLD